MEKLSATGDMERERRVGVRQQPLRLPLSSPHNKLQLLLGIGGSVPADVQERRPGPLLLHDLYANIWNHTSESKMHGGTFMACHARKLLSRLTVELVSMQWKNRGWQHTNNTTRIVVLP
ncbi:unnamed protein product [Urochloa humidicola]